MTSAGRRWPVCAAAGLTALLCAACAPPLTKFPPVAGSPVVDGSVPLEQATASCRAVMTLTAEIAVNGTIEGRRVRARLLAGIAVPDSARLEAVAPEGQPLFIFVTSGGDATLLLPRDGRVVEHGRPEAVLEAVAAVPLTPADLRLVLTGCAAAPDPLNARELGPDWRLIPDSAGDVYLRRTSTDAAWRVAGLVRRPTGQASGAWRAEFGDFAGSLPRSVRLVAADGRVDLRLALSQVELNTPLDRLVFQVQIPAATQTMTVDELRENGPLRPRTRGK